MTTSLIEQYKDGLEYVQNMIKLGGDVKVAEYQTRYINHVATKSVKEAIADLHLEQFATKTDINRLEKDINNLRSETTIKLNEFKVELLRWQIAIGIVIMSANFAMLKFMLH